ncbi:MAG: alkane 1-monooxygenase [Pseudobdellovibrio sp.]
MVYFFPYVLMMIGALGIYMGGWAVWTGFVLLFILFPIIEVITQKFKFKSHEFKNSYTDWTLIPTPVFLTAILLLALYKVQFLENAAEQIGLILSTGSLLGAFGITSAHELVHRREKHMKAIGVYNLTLVNFAHWGLEHVFGHHKHVATPLDPATARKNEFLYAFWVREYFASIPKAYKINPKKVSLYWLNTLLVSVLVFFVFGFKTLIFWWLISTVAILLLQTVDYIEHYGLQRTQNTEGHYIAFKPDHSWDTNSWLTNTALFNLGFHSHHHMKAIVKFEDLVEQKEARQLPYGYSVMVLLAFVPWAFIPMMNKRLIEKNAQ